MVYFLRTVSRISDPRDCHRSLIFAGARVVVLGMLLALASKEADALEIIETRWGFDGKVVRNRFNLLSVLVDNPKAEPFDGELWLRKRINVGTRVDAPLVEPVFVGPFARRWVQFYPYVNEGYEQFGLQERQKSGRETPEFDLPQPRLGWPARVIVDGESTGAATGLPVKGLPEVLFPPFVTATDGLQAVLIDSLPNWDEPRRTAFLNWLYRGGVAFVLQTPTTGAYPEFPAALGVLAGPLDEQRYGSGRVYRVAATRRDLSRDRLTELFRRLPERLTRGPDGTPQELPPFGDEVDSAVPYHDPYSDGTSEYSSTSFLAQLRNMTRPEHNWLLLHGLFWVYIALVFPGCWLIGRRWSDYRVVYLSLLATVALFSVLFAYVGQRGYGESTAVNSVAIVHPLPNGQADVALWSNAFVISGGDYEIRHQGSGTLYSTCNMNEAVNGEIQCGADARFLVDIPPFSSREYAQRMQAPFAVPRLQTVQFQRNGDRLTSLTLRCDPPFPETAENLVLLHGRQFYNLSRNGPLLELGIGMGDVGGYLRVGQYNGNPYPFNSPYGRETRPVIEQYRQMFIPLLTRSLGIARAEDAAAFNLPAETVRVCYFTQIPAELFVQNPYLGKQAGWALCVVDVPLEVPLE